MWLKWPVNVWNLHCWAPPHPRMKWAAHPCWNIKVPSDLISPRWRRSCSCWFSTPHRSPLQLFLICLLRLVVLYKSTAVIRSPGNVKNGFLVGFSVLGAVSESHDILAMLAAELQGWHFGPADSLVFTGLSKQRWMFYHDICYRHLWCHEAESSWLWWSSGATSRLIFVSWPDVSISTGLVYMRWKHSVVSDGLPINLSCSLCWLLIIRR